MDRSILNKIIFFAIATIFIIKPINSQNVWANETPATSMFVTPMIQEISLTPGETYRGSIKVSNSATAKYDLSYLAKIGAYSRLQSDNSNDDYGIVDTTIRSERNLIMDWITLDKYDGTISPNNLDTITFTINVPQNAPSGAQYASILFINDTKEDNNIENIDNNATIKNTLQIASAIIANVAGENIEKGSITENNIPSFLTTGPLEATSMVRNEGNIYTDAEYTLQVWPLFSDEEICTNEEEPETSLVLPDTERYHAQSCVLPTVGIFRAKQTVKIFGETSIVEKTIIVCPIWLLFVILFAIFALIFYIVIKVRAHKKSARKPQA